MIYIQLKRFYSSQLKENQKDAFITRERFMDVSVMQVISAENEMGKQGSNPCQSHVHLHCPHVFVKKV